jgi:DNA processing protein
MNHNEIVPWIALTALCRDDTRTAWRIVRRTIEMEIGLAEFFAMDPERRCAQFQDDVVRAVVGHDLDYTIDRAATIADALAETDTDLVRIVDETYPARLTAVAGDAVPPVLYVTGDTCVFDGPALGIVGSRNATEAGLEYAWILARMAAEHDIIVVSGGASGIDSAAHKGAVDAEGATIVVLPHGIAHGQGQRLADEHPDNVTIVSQFAPDMQPGARAALARNRTIAALSSSVVAVESGIVSGTMSTARHARDLDVPLFAVDWQDDETVHQGTAKLIDKGANPLPRDVTDASFAELTTT